MFLSWSWSLCLFEKLQQRTTYLFELSKEQYIIQLLPRKYFNPNIVAIMKQCLSTCFFTDLFTVAILNILGMGLTLRQSECSGTNLSCTCTPVTIDCKG